MVMLAAVGDADAEDDVTDKRRVWQRLSARSKVFGEAEYQFVNPDRQRSSFEQGLVAATVLVGNDAVQELAFSAFHAKHRHFDPIARQAERGIEHMCSESAHYLQFIVFVVMNRMIIPESADSGMRTLALEFF